MNDISDIRVSDDENVNLMDLISNSVDEYNNSIHDIHVDTNNDCMISPYDDVKLVRTAGGRSLFLEKDGKVYKKDASGNEMELYRFYSYLKDKPDLMKKFPTLYGIIEIDGEHLNKLIRSSPYDHYPKAELVSPKNILLCMENVCYNFKDRWVMDLKLARPKTVEKYHISRTIHEFSVHGISVPHNVDQTINFDHKENRDINYDNFSDIYPLIDRFFPTTILLDRFIEELIDINMLFKKYSFKFVCSILVVHDTQNMIVKIIDCSFVKKKKMSNAQKRLLHSGIEKNRIDTQCMCLKRLDFLIYLMKRIRSVKQNILGG